MKKLNKFYTITDNQIIIYPGTSKELNITEEEQECKYCIYNSKTCGHKQPYCDWQTFSKEWEICQG